MSARVEPLQPTYQPDPARLRNDLDLGLRMVEGLVRIGEPGAALRLVEELQEETARTLGTTVARPSRHVRRGASLMAGVAVALGVGLSAAALVLPDGGGDAKEAPREVRDRPAQVEENVPFEAESPAPETTVTEDSTGVTAPADPLPGEPAPDDAAADKPRFEPPEDISEAPIPSPFSLIVPPPVLPDG